MFGLATIEQDSDSAVQSSHHSYICHFGLTALAIAITAFAATGYPASLALAQDSAHSHSGDSGNSAFFLPKGADAKLVTVTPTGNAEAGYTIITQAVAVKETGPKATIDKFGEVYAWSPAFIAVHRDQPTEIDFWNLQPDDEHDFALLGPDLKVLMYEKLAPLTKTTYIFTFHREGAFDFKCLRHQPEMSGQFLVLPPTKD
jgi:plastocyanin